MTQGPACHRQIRAFYTLDFPGRYHHATHRATTGMEITTAARRARPGVEMRLRRDWPVWGRVPTWGSGRSRGAAVRGEEVLELVAAMASSRLPG
jgi:hypothetical protein